jgi:uncharacterized membrane protein
LIIFATRLQFGLLLILDQRMSALEALAGSWRMTRGKVLGLFGFNLLMFLIIFGGALACGIGLLFAIPFVMVCYASVYLHATRQMVAFDGRRPRPARRPVDDDLGRAGDRYGGPTDFNRPGR